MKIRVNNLRHAEPESRLRHAVAKRLGVPIEEILSLAVAKSSVDARKHQPVRVYNVEVELTDAESVLHRFAGDPHVGLVAQRKDVLYSGPRVRIGRQPLVVGTGPAGLFITLALIEKGYRPLVIDRGRPLRERWKDVNRYWNDGILDPESNVVFGDGGAGTFSDGKLTTRRNDPRNPYILGVLSELAQAPEIVTAGKPHLGTNRLSRALLALHRRLDAAGVEIRFQARLDDLVIEDGRLRGAIVNDERIETDAVFLAAGHSARDIFRMLHRHGVALTARPFAVGVRAEHPQALLNRAQLGTETSETGPADYLLAYNPPRGDRSTYTFCMCPGGEVVAAGTEAGGLTVNGMSYSHRAQPFGNAAVVVTVRPGDFGGGGPLAGLDFQRRLEAAAYEAGGGGHVAPAQRIPDFLAARPSTGRIETSYRRDVRPTDLNRILPPSLVPFLRRGIRHFGRLVRGYDGPDGVLIGLETRTSSPVRILRDPQSYQSVSVPGLYPAGEGAGYAGGIMSSASDGLRAVERIEAAAS